MSAASKSAMGTRGALRVMIIRADGLPKADLNGKADPYVKATIRHATRETRVVHATLEPVWNEPLEFLGVLDEFRKDTLILNVCDRDVLKHDDAMGQVRVSLSVEREEAARVLRGALGSRAHHVQRELEVVPLMSSSAARCSSACRAPPAAGGRSQRPRRPVPAELARPKDGARWCTKPRADVGLSCFTGVLHELLKARSGCASTTGPTRQRRPARRGAHQWRDRVTRGGGLDATIDVELALPDGCSSQGRRRGDCASGGRPDALAGAGAAAREPTAGWPAGSARGRHARTARRQT